MMSIARKYRWGFFFAGPWLIKSFVFHMQGELLISQISQPELGSVVHVLFLFTESVWHPGQNSAECWYTHRAAVLMERWSDRTAKWRRDSRKESFLLSSSLELKSPVSELEWWFSSHSLNWSSVFGLHLWCHGLIITMLFPEGFP